MHGIVSLLDKDHYQFVEDVWAGLKDALGVKGVYVTPFPHFSYHVADHYDLRVLEPLLRDFAAQTAPFKALTTGLGIFTAGINPVIYVSVARSPRLSEMNQAIWELAQEASAGIVEYYHPEQWVPHITLGYGDITQENLADAIRLLGQWDFTWEIPIDNIALLYSEEDAWQDKMQFRFKLRGGE